ncbi:unnamed protein product [Parajaminaea phylloscopi]
MPSVTALPWQPMTISSRWTIQPAVRGILPAWFATTMGTGIASILLRTMPYHFKGQDVIANAIFAFNTVWFVVLFALFVARCVLYPRLSVALLLHPTQSFFLGTIPQGFATILTMIVHSVIPAFPPARSHLCALVEALWWLNALSSTVIAIGALWLQIRRHTMCADLSDLQPFLFLSIAATVISAATGSTVAAVLPTDRAYVVAIASYVVLGTGLLPCLGFMSLHLLRTSVHGLPDKLAIISMFLPLGPCGQGGLALLQLSSVIRMVAHSRSNSAGTFLAATSAIEGLSIIGALSLWGTGLFWFWAAAIGVAYTAAHSGLKFNIGYWGCTFPIGAWTTSTLALGEHLDSNAFRILGTMLSALVVLLVAVMWASTLYTLVRGDIYGTSSTAVPTTTSVNRNTVSRPRSPLPSTESALQRRHIAG